MGNPRVTFCWALSVSILFVGWVMVVAGKESTYELQQFNMYVCNILLLIGSLLWLVTTALALFGLSDD